MGGAEKVLLRLLQGMDDDVFENEVFALTTVSPLAEQFTDSGIPVKAFGYSKGNLNIVPFFNVCRSLRQRKPDIVQTWLYHGDLLGGISARMCTRAPVLWNLRQSNLDSRLSPRSTRTIAKICANLSSVIPRNIVCGSHAALSVHKALGYDAQKMFLIENGFDTEKYQRTEKWRRDFRSSWGVSDDTVVIGHAARLDPQKDHPTLLHAAAKVIEAEPSVRFVLCGTDITDAPTHLRELIDTLGIRDHVTLLGIVDNMTGFYSALDIQVMSSAYGEGAPNVLGEAMSCETPCVTTDIGDSARIIGNTGPVVPVGNDQALSDAILSLVAESSEQRRQRGQAARRRIVEEMPLKKMIKEYQDLYLDILKNKAS